jgi:hypothetical protein
MGCVLMSQQLNGEVRSHAAAEQSLAADGAIAYFSSNLIPSRLNADRAPQLKASVRRLLMVFRKYVETICHCHNAGRAGRVDARCIRANSRLSAIG